MSPESGKDIQARERDEMEGLFQIENLMTSSRVKFGTSGARGLVEDMSDRICFAYTLAFIQHLEQQGELEGRGAIGLAGDLRPSTGRIMVAVAEAIGQAGYQARNCGRLPSPALACYGLSEQMPTVMVTGSHIPDDRNGIKYTRKSGEILKPDEAAMRIQQVFLPSVMFDKQGMLASEPPRLPVNPQARQTYVRRYLDFFPSDCLSGLKIGVFMHSAVGRDLMVEIYTALGAQVTPLGRSETFIPVDTEAIRPQDVDNARKWSTSYGFDAIVSTDGDSDRPLISDERGKWFRGDVAGILCASWLGVDALVTPVSCNSAVEKCGLFRRVIRTRIGSPFVIEAMQKAQAEGAEVVAGYEANGGFLLNSPIERWGRTLAPLPTRDAILLHLALLVDSREKGRPLSELGKDLPQRFTISDRLEAFPLSISHGRVAELNTPDESKNRAAASRLFSKQFGPVKEMDGTDGVRIIFDNDEIVHLRPSGNAPEFRCYTEADSEARAKEINAWCIQLMETWRE